MQEHSGLLSSVRSLLASVADMAHLRLELLVNELEEDRIYLIKLLIYSLLMLFFFFIGVVVLTIMIVTMFDQDYRAIALGIFTVIYLGVSAWLVSCVIHQIKNKPKMFSATLSELRKDRAALESAK